MIEQRYLVLAIETVKPIIHDLPTGMTVVEEKQLTLLLSILGKRAGRNAEKNSGWDWTD